MKMTRLIITVLLLIAALGSCKNDLISLEENIVEKAKDTTAPEVLIQYPYGETQFGQIISISGTISDNGKVMPTMTYQVVNDLGEIKKEGDVKITSIEGNSKVTGVFSCHFSSEGLNSDILVKLTATDWNGNVLTLDPLRLLYTGSALPSFKGKSGNNQLTLEWDKIDGIDEYTVYYTVDTRFFNKNSAHSLTVSSLESEEQISVSLTKDEQGIQNGRLVQIQVSGSLGDDIFNSPVIDLCPLSPLTLLPRLEQGNHSIKVYWNAIQAAEGEFPEYSVWRSLTGKEDSYKLVSPPNWSKTYFIDNTAQQGRHYFYKISSDNYSDIMSQGAEGEPVPFDFNPNNAQLIECFDNGSRNISSSSFTPDGSRLFIFDKSTKSLIETDVQSGNIVGSTLNLEEDIYGLTASSERVYALSKSSILSIDITTSGNPLRVLGEDCDLSGISSDNKSTAFVFKNNKLYMGCVNDKHYSIDLSAHSAPTYPDDFNEMTGDTFISINEIACINNFMYSLNKNASGKHRISFFSGGSWTHVDYLDDAGMVDSDLTWTAKINMAAGEASDKLVIICDTDFMAKSDVLIWAYNIQADGSLDFSDFKRLEDRAFCYDKDVAVIGSSAYCTRSNGSVQAFNIDGYIYEQDVIESRASGTLHLSAHEGTGKICISLGSSGIGLASITQKSILTAQETLGVSNPTGGQMTYRRGFIYSQEMNILKQYKVHTNGSLTLYDSLSFSDNKQRSGIVVQEDALISGRGSTINRYTLNESGDIGIIATSIQTMSDINTLYKSGDYLFAAESMGIEVFDMSDTDEISLKSVIMTSFDAKDLKVWQNYLFILDNGYGLRCYDISDPADPQFLNDFYDSSSSHRSAMALDIYNGNLYLGTDSGLFVLPLDSVKSWKSAKSDQGDWGSASYRYEGAFSMVRTTGNLLFCTKKFGSTNFNTVILSLENSQKPTVLYISPESHSINQIVTLGNHFYGRGNLLHHMYLQD